MSKKHVYLKLRVDFEGDYYEADELGGVVMREFDHVYYADNCVAMELLELEVVEVE